MTQPFLQAFSGQKPSHVPLWLMRQAGRYLPEYRAVRTKFPNFLEFCLNASAATEVTLQPVSRFGMDAAIIFADILTIPFALGHEVTFTEGEGPRVQPFEGHHQLQQVQNRLPEVARRLAPVAETVRLTRQALPADKTVVGFSGGPFTLACYMVDAKPSKGIPNLTAMARTDKPTFLALLDVLTQACIAYLKAQIAAGADAVQIFESWALICPDDLWDEAVKAPLLAIRAALAEAFPRTPVLLFPRGATQAQLATLAETLPERSGLSLATETNLAWACATLKPKVVLQGNLDPVLMTGDVEAMKAAAKTILDTAAPGGNFIFNLGHGLTPDSKPDNVQALVDLVHAWKG